MNKLLFLAALLLSGCSERLVGPDVTDSEAIQIAFFAELITTAPSSTAAAYCISAGDWANRQDLSTDVHGDLRILFGKVEQASACSYAATSITYQDSPARAYHIESWAQDGNTAQARGFWRDSNGAGASYSASLQKQRTLWVISSFQRDDELHAEP